MPTKSLGHYSVQREVNCWRGPFAARLERQPEHASVYRSFATSRVGLPNQIETRWVDGRYVLSTSGECLLLQKYVENIVHEGLEGGVALFGLRTQQCALPAVQQKAPQLLRLRILEKRFLFDCL